LFIFSF